MLVGSLPLLGRNQRLCTGQVRLQLLQLVLEPSRKDEQAHHFNQTDIFLFNVMQRLMRMENPQRMLRTSTIVAKHQQQTILAIHLPQNRRNRVMRLTIRFRINTAGRVAVSAPCRQ